MTGNFVLIAEWQLCSDLFGNEDILFAYFSIVLEFILCSILLKFPMAETETLGNDLLNL